MLGPIPWTYALWLGGVAIQRLLELGLSRANIARSGARLRGRAAEGSGAWFSMVALHVALIVMPLLEIAIYGRAAPAWLFATAFGVFALAQCLRAWSIRTLGTAWNARALVDPEGPLVEGGSYRWIRHPNYVALILEFITIPLGGGAWISALILNAAHVPVLARRIRAEERLLAQLPGWNERMASKNRFVPRLFRGRVTGS